MKIAISGTHSTGKTTFLDAVRNGVKPNELYTIARLAPEAAGHGFPILKQHTFESTLWLMAAGIKYELEACLKHPVLLVDRPVMEALAYLNAALKHRGAKITAKQRECLEGLARHHATTYDVVIKTVVDESLPIALREVKRDHDSAFRALVDREIDALYGRWGLPVRRLGSGDQQIQADIIDQVQRVISAHTATHSTH